MPVHEGKGIVNFFLQEIKFIGWSIAATETSLKSDTTLKRSFPCNYKALEANRNKKMIMLAIFKCWQLNKATLNMEIRQIHSRQPTYPPTQRHADAQIQNHFHTETSHSFQLSFPHPPSDQVICERRNYCMNEGVQQWILRSAQAPMH